MTGNAPNQRPVISLGLSPVLVAVELLGAIAILLAVLLIVKFWAVLPDRIPIHFGLGGLADAWGDKVTREMGTSLPLLGGLSMKMSSVRSLNKQAPIYSEWLYNGYQKIGFKTPSF
ncbi:DUF1648 domain-containing protein [Microcoleus sp. B6-A1]|uniref:DUF1648 domain-containing protein n=1 Tax=Microcoleus sp. B6-A1 TaxID=2818684 RepID=UPI002FD1AF90